MLFVCRIRNKVLELRVRRQLYARLHSNSAQPVQLRRKQFHQHHQPSGELAADRSPQPAGRRIVPRAAVDQAEPAAAIARDDDYFIGVLHSKLHELWSRRKGTQVREAESGFRYTPTSTFETFPFPWPPGHEPKDSPLAEAIAQAAGQLVEKRDAWLNPPGASADDLKTRTLTNLYNARPAWLEDLHRALDNAVFAAYG